MSSSIDKAFSLLDDYFGQEITYKAYQNSSGGDAALGVEETKVYQTENILARVREITLEEVRRSGGAYIIGDIEFKIRRDTVSYNDLIVYEGSTYKPFEIKKIWLKGLVGYRMRCRKYE